MENCTDSRRSLCDIDANPGTVVLNGKKYRLFGEIGRGSSCITYKAERCSDSIPCVIKEFYPLGCSKRENGQICALEEADEEFAIRKQLFFETAEIHDSLVPQIDPNNFMEPGEIDFSGALLLMRQREGETLAEWRRRYYPRGGIDRDYFAHCVKIVEEVVQALEQYHRAGFVHLDLKPDNVFCLKKNGKDIVSIIDFDSMQRASYVFEKQGANDFFVHTTANNYRIDATRLRQGERIFATVDEVKTMDYYAVGNVLYYLLWGDVYDSSTVNDLPSTFPYVLDRYLKQLFATKFFTHRVSSRFHSTGDIIDCIDFACTIIKDSRFFDQFNAESLRKQYNFMLMPSIHYQEKSYSANKEQGTNALFAVLSETTGNIQFVAEGGMGKSTALRHYTYFMARNYCHYRTRCHYRQLKKLIDEDDVDNLLETIRESAANEAKCVWLLDAADEIKEDEIRKKLLSELNNVGITDNIRVVLSSRTANEQMKKEGNYQVVALDHLTDVQISRLLQKYKETKPILQIGERKLLDCPMMLAHFLDINANYSYVKPTILPYLLGKKNGDMIEISTAGELIWNYITIVVLSSATDEEITSRVERLHGMFLRCLDVNESAEEAMRFSEGTDKYRALTSNMNRSLVEKNRDVFSLFSKLRICELQEVADAPNHCGPLYKVAFLHNRYNAFFRALRRYKELIELAEYLKNNPLKQSARYVVNDIPDDCDKRHNCIPVHCKSIEDKVEVEANTWIQEKYAGDTTKTPLEMFYDDVFEWNKKCGSDGSLGLLRDILGAHYNQPIVDEEKKTVLVNCKLIPFLTRAPKGYGYVENGETISNAIDLPYRILDALRGIFTLSLRDADAYNRRMAIMSRGDDIDALRVVTELLHYIYIENQEGYSFKFCNLSGLALGEIKLMENLTYYKSQTTDLYVDRMDIYTDEFVDQSDSDSYSKWLGEHSLPSIICQPQNRTQVSFFYVNFDNSWLFLKRYCWYTFENCSFSNLYKASFLHPNLEINCAESYYRNGRDLFNFDRTMLMDYDDSSCVPDNSPITLYKETVEIDYEFTKNCIERQRYVEVEEGNPTFYKKGPFLLGKEPWGTSSQVYFVEDTQKELTLNPKLFDNAELRYSFLDHCSNLRIIAISGEALELFMGTHPFSRLENLKGIVLLPDVQGFDLSLVLNCNSLEYVAISPNEIQAFIDFIDGPYKLGAGPRLSQPCMSAYVELKLPDFALIVPKEQLESYRSDFQTDSGIEGAFIHRCVYDTSRENSISELPKVVDDSMPDEAYELYERICAEDGVLPYWMKTS